MLLRGVKKSSTLDLAWKKEGNVTLRSGQNNCYYDQLEPYSKLSPTEINCDQLKKVVWHFKQFALQH